MNTLRRADVWDEVWAEYDARQARRAEAPRSGEENQARHLGQPHEDQPGGHGASRPGPARAGRNPMLHVGAAVAAGAVLLLAWFALPWILAARLSVPMGQGDAPGLMRQFDRPAALASLRDGLRAEVADETGAGARRFLNNMADRMAESWAQPEAVASWLAVRNRPVRGEEALASSPRSARALGLASFRLEYGPVREQGGVAFDVAWQGDGFRVTGVRFLRAPAAPPGGIAVAMR